MPPSKGNMAEKKFETALTELEEVVTKLESEDLPLEDSLGYFEKGIKLSRFCSKKLAEAEKKVDLLLKELSQDQTSDTASD